MAEIFVCNDDEHAHDKLLSYIILVLMQAQPHQRSMRIHHLVNHAYEASLTFDFFLPLTLLKK